MQDTDLDLAQTPLRWRLPSAAVRVWPDPSHDDPEEVLERSAAEFCKYEGVRQIEPGFFAVLPTGGDAAIFDAASAWSRDLIRRLSPTAYADVPDAPVSIMVFPTVALVDRDSCELISTSMIANLEDVSPNLPKAGVFLTSRACNMLETPPEEIERRTFEGVSGQRVPLVRVGSARSDLPPWRNPVLMGRSLATVSRPREQTRLAELLAEPAVLVNGALGCGKTRLVHHVLEAGTPRFLWLRARPARRPRPSLGDQMLKLLLADHPGSEGNAARRDEIRRQLAERQMQSTLSEPEVMASLTSLLLERFHEVTGKTLVLVIDDVEHIGAEDEKFVQLLLELEELGSRFRLVLIGRDATPPGALGALPSLTVQPLKASQMDELSEQMVEGLSLPAQVRVRFLDAAAGIPLAFEEGLFGLLHERKFRRVYGSFFFGGDDAADYRPSLRLVRHVGAEAERAGGALPAVLQALTGPAVPAAALAEAARRLGDAPADDWQARLEACGLLQENVSPWGSGVEVGCPAFRYALSFALPEDSSTRARRALGGVLSTAELADGSWDTYRLLSGSEQAVAPLLTSARTSPSDGVPREELLAALTDELELHRERGGDEKVELELLWRLLPLARRLGKLAEYGEQLSRGIELARDDHSRLLAIASIKAEMEQGAGDHRGAETTIQKALKVAAESDPRRQALLLIQLGKILLNDGRFDEASKIFRGVIEALPEAGGSALGATCRYYLGNIALEEGRAEEALEHHLAAYESREQQKLLRPAGVSLSALGAVSISLGNYPQALAYFKQALEILEEHGRGDDESGALLGIGRAMSRLGLTGAAKPLRRALELRGRADDVAGQSMARLAVAESYLEMGKPDQALEEARKAHFQLSMVSSEDGLADADQLLGRILLSQRKPEEALRHLRDALETHRARQDLLASGFDHAHLLHAAITLDDTETVGRQVANLKDVLNQLDHGDLIEILNFRLYEGLEWLNARGHKVGTPTTYLKRAYEQLLRKAGHLEPEQRHSFLFAIQVNGEIVDAATHSGVATGTS